MTRIRFVAAKGASADAAIQQLGEAWVLLGNLLQRRPDRAGDVETGAFGGRSCASITSSQTDCTRQFAAKEFQLGFDLLRLLVFAFFPQILEFIIQLAVSALVFTPGLPIKHLAGVAESSDAVDALALCRKPVIAGRIGRCG
ncbi:MAG: hypothetical protein ABSD30_02880 [Candidatus Binatus sp.]